MRVKRSVLQNLSTKELEDYIKDDSRFVPEAIEFAYEILRNERNIQFSEEESLRIENLISSKLVHHEKQKKLNSFEPNLVEDSTENNKIPKLHTKTEIIFHSSVFISFVGAYLLHKNLKILNKNSPKHVLVLILFVLFILTFDYFLYEFMVSHQAELSKIKYKRFGNFGIFITIRGITNFVLVNLIWNYFFGKNFHYRELK
jgi:hypothetical protein